MMSITGGINGIIYYSGTLLGKTGLSSYGASLVSGILFTVSSSCLFCGMCFVTHTIA